MCLINEKKILLKASNHIMHQMQLSRAHVLNKLGQ